MASKLHGTEVEVEIIKSKQESDHVQFLITQQSGQGFGGDTESLEAEALSLGN